MNPSTLRRNILLLAAFALLVIAPFVTNIVQLRMLTEIAYFALFAVSFNYLFGYAGLLSFGHAAYFGLGAYATAISLKNIAGMPVLASVLVGGLAGAIGGMIIGFFCVRRKGAYFALLTLAFNQFLWAAAWKWRAVTGGDDGIGDLLPDTPVNLGFASLDLYDTTSMYYFVVVIVFVCLAAGWYLTKTPFGNTVMATKVNEERASFLGYNANRSKVWIFTFSAFYAGIAGGLFACFQDFVSTSAIDLGMSTQVLFMAFLGGTGSFFGPILGAAVFTYFTDMISSLTDRWEFILGVLFILLVLFFRQGLIGLIPAKLKVFFFEKR
jgi:branched-chain amino acid transport system permease protein